MSGSGSGFRSTIRLGTYFHVILSESARIGPEASHGVCPSHCDVTRALPLRITCHPVAQREPNTDKKEPTISALFELFVSRRTRFRPVLLAVSLTVSHDAHENRGSKSEIARGRRAPQGHAETRRIQHELHLQLVFLRLQTQLQGGFHFTLLCVSCADVCF